MKGPSMKAFLKTAVLATTLCLLLPLAAVSAPHPDKEAAAIKAAELFIGLIDQGEYGQSWHEASSLFAGRITKEEWVEVVSEVRPPFGQILQRSVKGSQYVTSVPGAPDGEYVLILFISSFEHKASAVETVTAMLDTDGQWRVAGYYIQ
jgi:hypothetical protein